MIKSASFTKRDTTVNIPVDQMTLAFNNRQCENKSEHSLKALSKEFPTKEEFNPQFNPQLNPTIGLTSENKKVVDDSKTKGIIRGNNLFSFDGIELKKVDSIEYYDNETIAATTFMWKNKRYEIWDVQCKTDLLALSALDFEFKLNRDSAEIYTFYSVTDKCDKNAKKVSMILECDSEELLRVIVTCSKDSPENKKRKMSRNVILKHLKEFIVSL